MSINVSGDMYKGVPTLYLDLTLPSANIANPKSPIFQHFYPLSMLAGLRSLCSIPLENKCFSPSIIWLIISTADTSDNLPCFVTKDAKSPLGQYSVIM